MKCWTASAMELTWPGVPVTAWASIRPLRSNTPAERSPHSRTIGLNAVLSNVCACSLDDRDQAVPHHLPGYDIESVSLRHRPTPSNPSFQHDIASRRQHGPECGGKRRSKSAPRRSAPGRPARLPRPGPRAGRAAPWPPRRSPCRGGPRQPAGSGEVETCAPLSAAGIVSTVETVRPQDSTSTSASGMVRLNSSSYSRS